MPIMNKVNSHPPVLLGLTESELILVLSVSISSSFILLVIIFYSIGVWWIAIPTTPMLSAIVVNFSAKKLVKESIGKPDNYYPMYIKKKIRSFIGRFLNSPDEYEDGVWSIVRRNRFDEK